MKLLMVSKTDGTVCGIGEYGRNMAAAMPLNVEITRQVPTSVDGYDAVVVQWDYSFYPVDELSALVDNCTQTKTPVAVIMHTYLDPDRKWNFGHSHAHVSKFYQALEGATVIVHNDMIQALLEKDAPGLDVVAIPLACPAPREFPEPRNDRVKVGFFGFCVPWKGIEALMQLAKKNKAVDVELFSAVKRDWAGSTDMEKRVKKEAGGLSNFTHHAEFLPEDQAVEGLSRCDLIVMAYEKKEDIGASAAVRTAMSAGRPVVVTDVPFTYDFKGVLHMIPDSTVSTLNKTIELYKAGGLPTQKQREFLLRNNFVSVATGVLAELFKGDIEKLKSMRPHPDFIYDDPVQTARIEWLRGNAQKPFAEVGCACGFITEYLGGGVGLDIDDVRLEVARQTRSDCVFINHPANFLPEEIKYMDVLFPDILEHVPLEVAHEAVAAAIKNKNRVLITMPLPGGAYAENPEHLWLPTKQNLKELYAGLDVSVSEHRDDTFYYATVAGTIRAKDKNTKAGITALKEWRRVFRNPDPETAKHMYWRGVPIVDYPPDLFNLQEIIFKVRPKWIIETGTSSGGGTLFYSDMLRLLGEGGRVITMDYNDIRHEQVQGADNITFLQCCSDYPPAIESIRNMVGSDPVMVVLDGDYTEGYRLQELNTYAQMVTVGSYLIAKCGALDYYPELGTGVMAAVKRFLARHPEFTLDAERNFAHLITYHPLGYLRRVR